MDPANRNTKYNRRLRAERTPMDQTRRITIEWNPETKKMDLNLGQPSAPVAETVSILLQCVTNLLMAYRFAPTKTDAEIRAERAGLVLPEWVNREVPDWATTPEDETQKMPDGTLEELKEESKREPPEGSGSAA